MPALDTDYFESLSMNSKEFCELEEIASKVLQLSVYGTPNQQNMNINIFKDFDTHETELKIDDLSLKYENKERLLNFNFHRIRL